MKRVLKISMSFLLLASLVLLGETTQKKTEVMNTSNLIESDYLTSSITYSKNFIEENTALAQSGCEAEITVIENRNEKRLFIRALYKLAILNKGSVADTFVFGYKDINAICSNSDGSSNANNVLLDYSFMDVNRNPIAEIRLNAGESYNFLVAVTAPTKAEIDKWSCVEINAQSKRCGNTSDGVVLKPLS